MAKTQNYSPETTARIIEDYQAGISLEDIAQSIEKSVRSVRSKLVREGVYIAQPREAAKRQDGPSKKEILISLEPHIDVSGFEGATKEALTRLLSLVQTQQ